VSGLRWTEAQLSEHLGKSPPKKASKMRNTRVESGEMRFDSKREAARWSELVLMQAQDKISKLDHHRRFTLDPYGVWVCDYEADFSYLENGELIVEDVKPKFKTEAARKKYQRTDAYRRFALKKRLMLAVHGIEVKEV
jgi:hypothetical protein